MKEIFLDNYSLLTHIVESLAAGMGLLCYNRYKHSATRYFIIFLVYVAVCDFIGAYSILIDQNRGLSFLRGTVFEKNYWWYTLFWKIGAVLFFAYYYRKVIKSKRFKTVLKFSAYGFLTLSLFQIILKWESFFTGYFAIISVLGAIIVLLCTCFYFIEILNTDKILSFYKSVNFYITSSIFIWWLILTPLVFFDIYGAYEVNSPFRDNEYLVLRRYIYLFANLFLYLTFTFALIWCRPEKN
ncbi:hypothetical protein [Hyunsoonleella rubra]|uniref:Uncharacterized protein n=1 Tax=Hyunsoonleella rubra TaxID=1737062 RepID=A0ABW5TAZ9_9FLAO